MSDASDGPVADPNTLVIRAVFVPDGEDPPPEFAGDFEPLRIPATRDPATGQITCANVGISFDGDVLAQWVPDADDETEANGQDGAAPGDGTSSRATPSGSFALAAKRTAPDAVLAAGGTTASPSKAGSVPKSKFAAPAKPAA